MPSPSSIFVTGASRGIGLGLIRKFLLLKDVKHIFAAARDPAKSEELSALAKADSRLHLIRLDVLDDNSIASAVQTVQGVVGVDGLNVLVNNAGVLESIPLKGKPDRNKLLQQLHVNSVAPFVVIQYFLPLLEAAAAHNSALAPSSQRAAIVNISSQLGSIEQSLGSGYRNFIAYSMSKSAINQLTKSLSVDLKDIVSVSLHPGWVQTDMGTQDAPLTVEESVAPLSASIVHLQAKHSGGFFDRTLEPIPY